MDEIKPVAWVIVAGEGSSAEDKYLVWGKPEHYTGSPLYDSAALAAARIEGMWEALGIFQRVEFERSHNHAEEINRAIQEKTK